MTQQYRPKRQGKLKVIILARDLTLRTLQMVGNEKYFKKHRRWVMAQPIAEHMKMFCICTMDANNINAKTKQEAEERHKLQTIAIAKLRTCSQLMDLAIDVEGLNEDKIANWTALVNEELRLLSAWQKSDEKRNEKLGW